MKTREDFFEFDKHMSKQIRKEIEEDETNEKNKLIAEFMGIQTPDGLIFQDTNTKEFHSIKYHTSWDWLMPVVEKIDSMLADDEYITIEYKTAYIDIYAPSWIFPDYKGDSFTISGSGQTKIEAVYNCVMEFITWYNEYILKEKGVM